MDASVVAGLLEQTARAIYDRRGPHEIHPGQWAVLRYIAHAGRNARTIGGVAIYLGITNAPASRAVAALARKNLISVRTDLKDRRIRTIELTVLGRSLLQRDPALRLSSAIEALPVDRRQELAASLETIYNRLVNPSAA